MVAGEIDDFNNIIKQLIKKSLFTERQIQIITNTEDILPTISRGAYYRQRSQTRRKVEGLLYSMVLLYGLGVLHQESMRAVTGIADQLDVIFDSDIDEGDTRQILEVIANVVEKAMAK